MVIKKLKTLILIVICATCSLYSTGPEVDASPNPDTLSLVSILNCPLGYVSNAANFDKILNLLYLPFKRKKR